jgi:hypothetical protein
MLNAPAQTVNPYLTMLLSSKGSVLDQFSTDVEKKLIMNTILLHSYSLSL